MAPDDPQRAKLVEADEIASKIALAETDEQTKRAQVMYCLSAAIDDFPPALISHARRFVDCLDVEDTFSDGGFGQGPPQDSLHCSLLLFDDKLLIVKRPGHGEKGARALSGLDDLDRLNKSGGRPPMKKSGMSSKGVVEVTDVVVTDIGGSGASISTLSTLPRLTYRRSPFVFGESTSGSNGAMVWAAFSLTHSC